MTGPAPRWCWVAVVRVALHIGAVLKVLEAAGIQPALVVGSSAGAIAGSLLRCADSRRRDRATRPLTQRHRRIADPAFLRPNRFIGRAAELHQRRCRRPLSNGCRGASARLAAPVGRKRAGGVHPRQCLALRALRQHCHRCSCQPRSATSRYEDGDMVSPVPIRIARQLGATRVVAVDVSAFSMTHRSVRLSHGDSAGRRAPRIIDAEAVDADYYLFRVRLPLLRWRIRASTVDPARHGANDQRTGTHRVIAAQIPALRAPIRRWLPYSRSGVGSAFPPLRCSVIP